MQSCLPEHALWKQKLIYDSSTTKKVNIDHCDLGLISGSEFSPTVGETCLTNFEKLFECWFIYSTMGLHQIPAKRGPDLRFVFEAIFKPLVPMSNGSRVIKLMDWGWVTRTRGKYQGKYWVTIGHFWVIRRIFIGVLNHKQNFRHHICLSICINLFQFIIQNCCENNDLFE